MIVFWWQRKLNRDMGEKIIRGVLAREFTLVIEFPRLNWPKKAKRAREWQHITVIRVHS